MSISRNRDCVCGAHRPYGCCTFCEALTLSEYNWYLANYLTKGPVHEATPDTKKLLSNDTKSAASKQELDPKAGVGAAKVGVQWVPPSAIIAIDEALAEGRIKYGTAKWRETKTEYMTYIGGALRHLYAFVDGEDIDPDSIVGKRHLAGALASLAILVDAIDCGTAVDNRPTKGGSPKRFATVKK